MSFKQIPVEVSMHGEFVVVANRGCTIGYVQVAWHSWLKSGDHHLGAETLLNNGDKLPTYKLVSRISAINHSLHSGIS